MRILCSALLVSLALACDKPAATVETSAATAPAVAPKATLPVSATVTPFNDGSVTITVTTMPQASVRLLRLDGSFDTLASGGFANAEGVIKLSVYGSATDGDYLVEAAKGSDRATTKVTIKRLPVQPAPELIGMREIPGQLQCLVGGGCIIGKSDAGTIEVFNIAPGAVVSVDGGRGVTVPAKWPSGTDRLTLALDALPVMAELPVETYMATTELENDQSWVTIKVVFKDGAIAQGGLRVERERLRRGAIMEHFMPGRGPIAVPEEGAGNAIWVTTGAWLKERGSGIGGKPAKWGDIGRVLGQTTDKVRKVSCGNYVDRNGGSVKVTREMVDITFAVFDRRTGKVLEEKTFAAGGIECPPETGSTELVSVPDEKEMLAWVEAQKNAP